MATSRCFYASALLVNNEVERGTEVARLGAEAAARLGLYPLVAEGLGALAIAHAIAGEFDAEREMHLARLAVAREHGDVARTADALTTLAEIALDEADARRPVRTPRRRSPSPTRPCRWRPRRPDHAGPRRDGRRERARHGPHAGAGAGVRGEDRSGLAVAQCARVAASLAAARGRAADAVRLYAAAQRIAPSPSGTDEPVEGDLAGGLETARAALGEEAFAREWTLGTSLSQARVREVLREVAAAVPV